jgi:threonine/homoserine/homoserine lactone efflux protein
LSHNLCHPHKVIFGRKYLLSVLIIVVVMIAVDLPIVFAAGRFSEWLRKNESINSLLSKLIGTALVGLAVRVFFTRKPS